MTDEPKDEPDRTHYNINIRCWNCRSRTRLHIRRGNSIPSHLTENGPTTCAHCGCIIRGESAWEVDRL